MKKMIIASLLMATTVWAGPKCTDEKKDSWLKQEDFQKKLVTDGYKIKKFKVTDGNCYEIYGWDKTGKKVEIYFNPMNGDIVKQN